MRVTMDLDGKVSCLRKDVRGSRMREMSMEFRRKDLDTWLLVA